MYSLNLSGIHLEQQVELRKKVESGSTIADSEAAKQVHLSCGFFFWVEQTTKASTSNVVDRATMFFFPTCCGQGTWSLLQRKVRSERSGIKKTKVCTDWGLSGVSIMYIQWSAVQLKNELSDAEKHRATQKNLPKALTAVFSPSRAAGRAPQESSIWLDHCRRRGGVAFASLVCGFFFQTTMDLQAK